MARPDLGQALARLGATGIASVPALGELFGLYAAVEQDYVVLSSMYDTCIAALKEQVGPGCRQPQWALGYPGGKPPRWATLARRATADTGPARSRAGWDQVPCCRLRSPLRAAPSRCGGVPSVLDPRPPWTASPPADPIRPSRALLPASQA